MFGYIIARNWLHPIEYLWAKVYIRCMRQALSDNSLIVDFDNEVQVMLKGGGEQLWLYGNRNKGQSNKGIGFRCSRTRFLKRHVTFKT